MMKNEMDEQWTKTTESHVEITMERVRVDNKREKMEERKSKS